MRDHQRDPYATPSPPRERSGPMLRLAIVAALLVAAVWAYMTYSQGPGLTQAVTEEQPAAVADARATHGYGLAPSETPETAPPPETPSAAPAPSAEPVPPPSTTTVPPA